MLEDSKYYVIKKKAVPEVLLKVLEVQKLLDAEQAKSIQEATETVGISRSSYYKYKDDFSFSCEQKGTKYHVCDRGGRPAGSYGHSASGICKLQGQYPDDPSEYSDQRKRSAHSQRGYR